MVAGLAGPQAQGLRLSAGIVTARRPHGVIRVECSMYSMILAGLDTACRSVMLRHVANSWWFALRVGLAAPGDPCSFAVFSVPCVCSFWIEQEFFPEP